MPPRRTSSSARVEYNRGLHLLGTVLWFDAPRRADLCFLSHAHFARPVPHRKILTTPITAALVRPRLHKARTLLCPYHRSFALGELGLMLVPAGHIAGSAQLVVEHRAERIVYTGHFSLSSSRCAQAAEIPPADVLILHAMFEPRLRLPPREEEESSLVEWVEKVINAGEIPVFLCSETGKSQEIALLLLSRGLSVRAERRVLEACRRVQAVTGIDLSGVRRARSVPKPGEVLLAGPSRTAKARLRRNARVRLAAASGWSLVPGFCEREGLDRAFAISLHADFGMLERYLEECSPRRVFLFGPGAGATAEILSRRNREILALSAPEQLPLPLTRDSSVAS